MGVCGVGVHECKRVLAVGCKGSPRLFIQASSCFLNIRFSLTERTGAVNTNKVTSSPPQVLSASVRQVFCAMLSLNHFLLSGHLYLFFCRMWDSGWSMLSHIVLCDFAVAVSVANKMDKTSLKKEVQLLRFFFFTFSSRSRYSHVFFRGLPYITLHNKSVSLNVLKCPCWRPCCFN